MNRSGYSISESFRGFSFIASVFTCLKSVNRIGPESVDGSSECFRKRSSEWRSLQEFLTESSFTLFTFFPLYGVVEILMDEKSTLPNEFPGITGMSKETSRNFTGLAVPREVTLSSSSAGARPVLDESEESSTACRWGADSASMISKMFWNFDGMMKCRSWNDVVLGRSSGVGRGAESDAVVVEPLVRCLVSRTSGSERVESVGMGLSSVS